MTCRKPVANGPSKLARTRRAHPSPLWVDSTRVNPTPSEPRRPGTFENAPPYPCHTRAVAWLLVNES